MIQVFASLFIGTVILGANVYGSLPLIFGISLLGAIVFINIGFIASGITKTARAANGLATGIVLPMLFFSGVFFPRTILPNGLRIISEFLPLSHLIDAIRAVALNDKGIFEIGGALFALTIWLVITFIIGLRVFRFER
jgi:ABC-2 type transport system permease protein